MSADYERPNQRTLTVNAEGRVDGVQLTLRRPYLEIAGAVRTPDGAPAREARVFAVAERNGRAYRLGALPSDDAVVDADGHFTIRRLPAGPHSVWAIHPAYAEVRVEHVAAGKVDLDLRLAPQTELSGVVRASGAPVRDYVVRASADDRPNSFENPVLEIHDPSGAFFFRGLMPGRWSLWVTTRAGLVGSAHGIVLEGRQAVEIAIDGGLTVRGQVVDRLGAPASRRTVAVIADPIPGTKTETDAAGRFSLSGVPPTTTLRLVAYTTDCCTGTGRVTTYVTVPAGAVAVDAGTLRLE
jgi:hypothetical protein